MADTQPKSQGTGPPLTEQAVTYRNPRRVSPANSVTLRHHRLAHDASMRASPASAQPSGSQLSNNRRNSSGDSHDTGQSDPMNWFDKSNQNPTATFGNAMDVDPPFFQKESDSSNDDIRPLNFQNSGIPPKQSGALSSSGDDYRSVIDDLTVEIQKLKEELKRYKQKGPDMLRKEKLFEIKIHGLPKRKRRELETTLRDFAASLEGSPDASSSQLKKSSRHANRDHMYSASGSMSKHASSTSGSNARPVDSAYASMSTGANSSGTSFGRSMTLHTKSNEQKVESYLRDIPEGLYPRHMAMTEKEKKKLVVRRLEQLFTGRIAGRHVTRGKLPLTSALAPVTPDTQSQQRPMIYQPPTLLTAEPSREARILPTDQPSGLSGKKSQSRDNGSASNSNGDRTESRGNGNSSGSGTNTSPTMPPPPEQRPTRPKDLDPDRVQVPSENMEYIRHLGLLAPELLAESGRSAQDVYPDADGWVYLNLLCNLAQLHIINVTPGFVRSAVTEISTKFQLSPDGRKIRWRGGTEGTRFGSDSSGANSQRSPDSDDSDSVNKDDQRKRQKTGRSTGDEFQSGTSSKDPSKFGPQISGSSESFHYKPLFVHRESSKGETSMDDTLSSFGPVEESNVEDSRWGLSGSGGTSNRRKRRHDGAIIYYSGAPFCTDLSGDPGDVSPTTYMLSSGQEQQLARNQSGRPPLNRSESGSYEAYKPLSVEGLLTGSGSKMDVDVRKAPSLTTDSGDDSDRLTMEFPWSEDQQYIEMHPLEPCGLGGVLPDDHFMVVVTTKRPKNGPQLALHDNRRSMSEETTGGIIGRLATMSTSSPMPPDTRATSWDDNPAIEIEYLSGRIKRLAPVPLPPPAIFFPPFSTDSSSVDDEGFGSEDDDDDDSSGGFVSRQANPHQSDGYPDGVDLTSGDEDGEDPDDEVDPPLVYEKYSQKVGQTMPDAAMARRQSGESAVAAAGTARGRSKSASAEMVLRIGGSSAATAGGVGSTQSGSVDMSA